MAASFRKATRGKAAVAESAQRAQFRLLVELTSILEGTLAPGPSEARIRCRDFKAMLHAQLGEDPTLANSTDVAWEGEPDETLE